MSRAMLERAAETGRTLGRLLEQGCEITIRRSRTHAAMVKVCVERRGIAPQWYDGGTLDACVAQIAAETETEIEHLRRNVSAESVLPLPLGGA